MTPTWSIVLAAGSGTRLSSLTGGIPKQYWRPGAEPTLLERTLARMGPVSDVSRTLVVASEAHRPYFSDTGHTRCGVETVFQPIDRGTAVGMLLGLLPVLSSEPDAVVVFTPSDHGVTNQRVFDRGLRTAILHAERSHQVVLGSVAASGPTGDYGWIVPRGQGRPARVNPVKTFVEKPGHERAATLWEAGAAWNMMVVVARARVLLSVYEELLPETVRAFAPAIGLSPANRDAYLARCYPSLASADFSRDLMERASNIATYIWPASLGWSDLGTPERMTAWQTTEPTSVTVPASPFTIGPSDWTQLPVGVS